jgi:hypothetical protein
VLKLNIPTTKGNTMAEQFIDTVAEHITGAMEQEIAEHLYEQWTLKNLDEGSYYAEREFMEWASDELKVQYNNYYGLSSGDADFYEVTD